MSVWPLSVRFEQRRGHVMIVECDPPLSRSEINETQLRMLQHCEAASLLPLEIEECDGQVSLRFSLAGSRRLAEATRAVRWSMSEMMEALCRLADTLEECRMIMLDAERVRLQDEFIFIGNDVGDIRFTYLPLAEPRFSMTSSSWKEDLERLVVRWMMRVKEPDGPAFQQVLRLISSAEFVPAALSRFGKRYLAEAWGGEEPPFAAADCEPEPVPVSEPKTGSRQGEAKPRGRSWDLLQPATGDAQPVSELWGEPRAFPFDAERRGPDAPRAVREQGPPDVGRWRTLIGCASLLTLAATWKFVYLDRPGEQQLLVSACLTLIAGAAVLLFWNGPPWRYRSRSGAPAEPGPREIEAAFRDFPDEKPSEEAGWRPPGFPVPEKLPDRAPAAVRAEGRGAAPDTTWISEQERTAYLDGPISPGPEEYHLIWKSGGEQLRISLRGDSFVIGRSEEAADHVDETAGVSRAHVEFVRVSGQWKVKDLGSRNGTRLNDRPMAPYELYPLQAGDCIAPARSQYIFQPALAGH
ncbi:DUF6382 domain-containing protein [Cohnella hongkongensis]|uniref:DUF6382 domain-containing protein n=1 Tax=Cohnella hongkongensis TaxID=178337 RepID=A0ABV9FGA6_9BACL